MTGDTLKRPSDRHTFFPRILWALLPIALVALLYVPSLNSAYLLDDFAWLSLRNTMANGHSLLWALFSPQAQGTIRPLGERTWFLLASSWFGLNPVPFHLLALGTQFLNLLMVIVVGRRLTGFTAAGIVAAALWTVNDVLVEPLVWASAFNEVLYTFLFLVAFYAFLRWISTRTIASRRPLWLVLHIAAFVLALGALELAVTLPAVAAAYVLLTDKSRWKTVLPSAALAFGFVALHLVAIGLPAQGPYQLTLDWGVLANLAHFWVLILGPQEYARTHPANSLLMNLATLTLTAMILGWTVRSGFRKRWLPVFFLFWFVITLAPMLPLLGHQTPYYAFLPSIGIAWLAGDAITGAASWPGRTAAVACAIVYAVCQIPSTIFVRDWNQDRARGTVERELLLRKAVYDIRQAQPAGPVFLSGIDWEQFWWGMCYGQLTREGFRDIHLLPDAAAHGVAIPPKEWCLTPDFQLSSEEFSRLLKSGQAVVYDIAKSPPLRLSGPK